MIVQSGLKFLEQISKTKEGVEYLKKDGIGMKALVTLLEKHPEEKGILNSASNILGRVATISDLNNALGNLKDGGIYKLIRWILQILFLIDIKKANLNAAILSSLTLVDEMMEEVIKKNGVQDMIAMIQKNINAKNISSEDQKKLIKNCAIAIGRVAQVDEKQVKLYFLLN